MQPKLVGGDFREEPRTRESFIDWLKRFLRGDNIPGANFAGVLVHDVPNIFVECSNKLKLMRYFKTDDLTLVVLSLEYGE